MTWVPNDFVDHCMNCEKKFLVLFRLKHHCRACGNLFCDDCSPFKEYVPPFYTREKVRICTGCKKKATIERQRRKRNQCLNRTFTGPVDYEGRHLHSKMPEKRFTRKMVMSN